MKLFIVVLASIVLGMHAKALPQELPLPVAADILHGKIVRTDFYTGESLYGYIDGGADLYLEYGFKKLGRQEIVADGLTIVVEIYQMQDPLHAFGIFSILRSKCSPVDSTSIYSCESKYQLQAVVGECYLSIINESGTTEARRTSIGIFRAIQSKRTPVALKFPGLFQSAPLRSHINSIFTAYGNLGIQNRISEWEPLFREISAFSVFVLPIETGDHHISVARVTFSSPDASRTFERCAGFSRAIDEKLQILHMKDTERFAVLLGTNEVLFVESSPPLLETETFVRSILSNR